MQNSRSARHRVLAWVLLPLPRVRTEILTCLTSLRRLAATLDRRQKYLVRTRQTFCIQSVAHSWSRLSSVIIFIVNLFREMGVGGIAAIDITSCIVNLLRGDSRIQKCCTSRELSAVTSRSLLRESLQAPEAPDSAAQMISRARRVISCQRKRRRSDCAEQPRLSPLQAGSLRDACICRSPAASGQDRGAMRRGRSRR